MGENGGTFWLPESASTLSGEIDALFYFVYWISVVIFVGVVGTMIYFVIKYRRTNENQRTVEVHENKWIEAAWIVVPTILVLVVFTWGFQGFLKLAVAPPDSYEIRVTGQKWIWQIEYPNGVRVGGKNVEIHVPAGRPIRLKMSSADVLHSFFIPAFRVKQDVLPDRYTSLWFEPTRQDTFQVLCTEYCGTQHSDMLARVIVEPQDVFDTWLKTQQAAGGTPAEMGAILYEQLGCQACHSLDGSVLVGPSFQGLYGAERPMASGPAVTADDDYIRESILQPNAKVVEGYPPAMPMAYSNLSEDDLNALIAFIQEQQ